MSLLSSFRLLSEDIVKSITLISGFLLILTGSSVSERILTVLRRSSNVVFIRFSSNGDEKFIAAWPIASYCAEC